MSISDGTSLSEIANAATVIGPNATLIIDGRRIPLMRFEMQDNRREDGYLAIHNYSWTAVCGEDATYETLRRQFDIEYNGQILKDTTLMEVVPIPNLSSLIFARIAGRGGVLQDIPMTIPSYTRHPEYASWMRAIRANPADDNVRLQYADWLDEQRGSCERCRGKRDWYDALTGKGKCYDCHGTGTNGAGERAEYIRLGIERFNYGTNDVPESLVKRYKEIYRREWFEPVESFGIYGEVFRGFIAHVRCTLAQFEQYAGEIARHHPVTKWEVTDREPKYYDDKKVYGWWDRYVNPGSCQIGRELLDALIGHETEYSAGKTFFTREAALEALNAACIQVANERAEALENPAKEEKLIYNPREYVCCKTECVINGRCQCLNTVTTRG